MEREWDFEAEEETEEVLFAAEAFATRELFGVSSVGPVVYHCSRCEKGVLAQDVAWDASGRPRCPTCKFFLGDG